MVDYSKWKNIEISDDEDDVHPNIDTASLFRWRHQARMEKMDEQQKEKAQLQKNKQETQKKVNELTQKLKQSDPCIDMTNIKVQLEELEKQNQDFKRKEEELLKQEKLQPWNVDTISQQGFNKTIINKAPARKKEEELTDDERDAIYRKFVNDNSSSLKKFSVLQKYEDSKKFLMENQQLACEETANYLVMLCINMEMEGKTDLMLHMSHQCICMQFILELAKQLDTDPRACISPFFSRIQVADQAYREGFENELSAFRDRVRARAAVKREQFLKEAEEEERQERMGPGGLDPMEVFDTLPKSMQDCFEKRDIAMLQKVIAELPEEEARYHMKRCVDSGLWVPEAKNTDEPAPEPVYSEATPAEKE